MRIGVLSDLHCELEPSGSRWINVFEPEHLDDRIDAALGWFAQERVDLILLLGDVVQFANAADLEHAFTRLASAEVAPLAAVGGNHDLRLEHVFAERAALHGIGLPAEAPCAGVAGVGIGRGTAPPQYVGRLDGRGGVGELAVVASHFPLLSEATKVAAAGLPYAGDLVNRAELEHALRGEDGPTLVLSGHIHARCSTHDGPLLQLTVGALIEPPFDATLVEIEGASVRRTARRLGEIAVTDPVFAPDEERWEWAGGAWHAA